RRRLIRERVSYEDRVLTLGAGRKQRYGTLDQLLDRADVLDRLRRKLSPGPRAAGGLSPAFECLVDGLHTRLGIVARRQTIDALPVEHVPDTHLHLGEAIEHVELRQ